MTIHTITPEMIRAGERVLTLACEGAEIWPPSDSVISAAREVYIAMEIARPRPVQIEITDAMVHAAYDELDSETKLGYGEPASPFIVAAMLAAALVEAGFAVRSSKNLSLDSQNQIERFLSWIR